jgi:hypothetical protein
MKLARDIASRSRVTRTLLTITAATVALVLGTAGVAQAGGVWQLTDTFDSDPASRWSIGFVGAGSGNFSTSGGNTWGWVTKTDSDGWSEIGRTVHLTPAQLHQAECTASVSLRASVDGSTSAVNVEVIDPTSWTYVALRPVKVTGSDFQAFAIGPWTPGPVDVYFRLALLGSGSYRYLGVDDVVVQCVY